MRRFLQATWRIAKRIPLLLLILAAFLAAVGMFLPASYRVERSVLIEAEPAAIDPYLSTLRRWPEWTPWTKEKYPGMEISFEGPESGVGAVYRWTGERTGNGMLRLTEADPQQGIAYDLRMDGEDHVSTGRISLEKASGGTKVTWANGGELGMNPLWRWLGLFLDRLMGADFESGLGKLKRLVEKG